MSEAIVKQIPNEQSLTMTPASVRTQVNLIQQVMKEVMQKDQHYGTIPGCGPKPALLKAGAEKLAMVFRLAPSFKIEIDNLERGHREYRITCTLTHIITGDVWGQGVGSCSTMETKYRYRGGKRKCPQCQSEAIIQTKGGRNPGGFWCVPDKGGCGANFSAGDASVLKQEVGKVENPDIADQYNTVLKMAKKRAQVDATLTATAASDIFTQDIEERLGDAMDEADAVPRTAPKHSGPVSTDTECFDALVAKCGEGEWDTFIVTAEDAMEKPAADFTPQDWGKVMESIKVIPVKPKK